MKKNFVLFEINQNTRPMDGLVGYYSTLNGAVRVLKRKQKDARCGGFESAFQIASITNGKLTLEAETDNYGNIWIPS